MSKVVYAAIFVVLLVVGGVIYLNRSSRDDVTQRPDVSKQASPQNQMQSNPISMNSIVYGDSGFSPQSINIKVGDSVTFTNQSSVGMWVASAPHPAHTDYPEFNAKKTYAKGESYSFTFTKAGVWKFHNHVKSTDFGSVTVK